MPSRQALGGAASSGCQRAAARQRAPRRLPNDSIVVALRAGVVLAERERDAAAWVADVFLVGALLAVLFVAGAFAAVAVALRPADAFFAVADSAAVAFAVGRRVGAAVAETDFLRAVRVDVVVVGRSAGDLGAVAPVARFVAVAAFFAAPLAGGGAVRAPVSFRARPACAIVAP